jgi:hypothetical protein
MTNAECSGPNRSPVTCHTFGQGLGICFVVRGLECDISPQFFQRRSSRATPLPALDSCWGLFARVPLGADMPSPAGRAYHHRLTHLPSRVKAMSVTSDHGACKRAPSSIRARSRHSAERETVFAARRLSTQSVHGGAHRLHHPAERYMDNCTSCGAVNQVPLGAPRTGCGDRLKSLPLAGGSSKSLPTATIPSFLLQVVYVPSPDSRIIRRYIRSSPGNS